MRNEAIRVWTHVARCVPVIQDIKKQQDCPTKYGMLKAIKDSKNLLEQENDSKCYPGFSYQELYSQMEIYMDRLTQECIRLVGEKVFTQLMNMADAKVG